MKTSILHPTKLLALTLLLLFSALRCASSAAPGDVDLSFDPGSGVNGTVNAVAMQPDGKVLIGGQFTTVKGLARSGVARLNIDGTGDGSFDAGALISPGHYFTHVYAVVLQPDGKVLVGQDYAVTRLHSDGSLDNSFNLYAVGGDYIRTTSLALQADGKVLVGGYTVTETINPDGSIDYSYSPFVTRVDANGNRDISFNHSGAGAESLALQPDGKILIGGGYGIIRLNPNGGLDSSFNPGANGSVHSVVVQSDGKVLIGGERLGSGTNRHVIARLNADGSLDSSFNPGAALTGAIEANSVVVQPDGKVLIGGEFVTVNGTTRNGVARLNVDGSLDNSFHPGTGASGGDGGVSSVALQPDGKVVIGGSFTKVNGVIRHRIARLNVDGSLDGSFRAGSGVAPSVYSLAVQADGKTLIGGDFSAIQDLDRSGIARLNADGSLDLGFDPGAGITGGNSVVNSVFVQSDGKVLIGGDFRSVDGTPQNEIARLNADGSLDGSFSVGIATGDPNGEYDPFVSSIAVQPDGRVLIGGNFYAVNGANRHSVARLNFDGSLDGSFNPGTFSYVQSIVLQPDGKVLVGGSITDPERNGITRLNPDGSPDGSFNGGAGVIVFGYVASVALQVDGKVLIGGAFSTVNGTNRNGIARLNADGSLDGSFTPDIGISFTDYPVVKSMVVQSDGKVLIGGAFSTVYGTKRDGLARLNANGSLDGSFNPGAGVTGGEYPVVRSIAVQSDGNVLIGGDFTTVNGVARSHVARLFGDSGSPPNMPPSVSISSPTDGSTYAGPATVEIDVDATDSDGTVVRVDVYAGDTLLASDSTAPFEISWENVPAGNYSLTADATDNLGATSTSAAVNIVVTNTAPTVAIASPVSGSTFTAPASIAITVAASDSDGTIARVEVYAGETLISSDSSAPFEVTWRNAAAGNYSLTAIATDNLGVASTSPAVNISVTTAPLPAAPSGLTARAVSRTKIKLHWIDIATDETSYKIERSVNGKPFTEIAQVGMDVTRFADGGLLPGKKYLYRVRASNEAGDSAYSNTAKAKTRD